jgi:hypothetical protein
VSTAADGLSHLFTGVKPPSEPLPGLHEAVVVQSGAAGVKVSIPTFHPTLAFGPCAYGRPLDGSAGAGTTSTTVAVGYPPVGTRCLVGFAGSNAWVVAFSGWPQ